MATKEYLETVYSASIIDFTREVQKMQKISRQVSDKIATDQNRMAAASKAAWEKADIGGSLQKSMSKGVAGASLELAKLAPILSAAFAGNAAIGAADAATRFSNSLKVAGLSGDALAKTQDHLYASAIKYGSNVEALGATYSRVAMSARQLGLSQADVVKITDTVAAATKVAGKTSEEAAGAQLQLSQALSGGTVHAEEWNSLLENMYPLVLQAAAASEKYGGNVAKMTADVKAGKLSSQEFSAMIMASKDSLEALAATSQTTVGQALENLKTALTQAIGKFNDTYGVTNQLANGLKWLSENTDTLKTSLIVLAGVFAVSMAPAIGAATIKLAEMAGGMVVAGVNAVRLTAFQASMNASMMGTSVAAEAAAIGIRSLISSTGVGLLVTGLTVALGMFAEKAMKSAEATRKFDTELSELEAKNRLAAQKALEHKAATNQMGDAQTSNLRKVANMTGEIHLMAEAWGRVALEAKRAALEQQHAIIMDAHKKVAQAKTERDAANAEYQSAKKAPSGSGIAMVNTGSFSAGAVAAVNSSNASNVKKAQERKDKADRMMKAQTENLGYQYKEFDRVRDSKVEGNFGSAPVVKPKKTKIDPAIAKAEAQDARGDQLLRQSQQDLINAQRDVAYTLEERHAANLKALDAERQLADEKIADAIKHSKLGKNDPEIQKAKANLDEVTRLKKKAEDDDYARAIAARAADIDSENIDIKLETMRLTKDQLNDMAANAKTTEEKQKYENAALLEQQKIDREAFARAQAQKKVELEKLGLTQDQVNKMLADRQKNFDAGQAADTANLNNDHAKQLPTWGAWLDNLATSSENLTTQLQGLASNGLNSIIDGLANAGLNAKNLAGAFKDTVKSMIVELEKLALKFLVFEALGMAFGVKGLGAKAIGLSKNASGTNYFAGGLSLVGENGPEVIAAPRGTQIGSNNLLRKALDAPKAGFGGNKTVNNNYFNIEANNSLVTSELQEMMFAASLQAAQAGRQGAQADIYGKSRRTF